MKPNYLVQGQTVRAFVCLPNTPPQSGMAMGGVRHVADIKVDDLSRQGSAVIGLQASLIYFHYSSVPFCSLATLGPRVGYV